jgi:hypothetical protein
VLAELNWQMRIASCLLVNGGNCISLFINRCEVRIVGCLERQENREERACVLLEESSITLWLLYLFG